ncbi:MAG: class D sortase [Candidatus Acidiferrales bacterium]
MNPIKHTLSAPRRMVFPGLRWASYVFLVAGVLAAGYAAYIIADSKAYQAVELRKFNHSVPLAEPHLPIIGEVIGQIEIPAVAIKAVILHGDSPELLRRGVGHLPETPMPGEWGNVALAGHRDTFFRPLRQLRPGEVITVRTIRGVFQYRVESIRVVSPKDIGVLASSSRRELTLVTCFPFHYVGAAPNRFIVRAFEVKPLTE